MRLPLLFPGCTDCCANCAAIQDAYTSIYNLPDNDKLVICENHAFSPRYSWTPIYATYPLPDSVAVMVIGDPGYLDGYPFGFLINSPMFGDGIGVPDQDLMGFNRIGCGFDILPHYGENPGACSYCPADIATASGVDYGYGLVYPPYPPTTFVARISGGNLILAIPDAYYGVPTGLLLFPACSFADVSQLGGLQTWDPLCGYHPYYNVNISTLVFRLDDGRFLVITIRDGACGSIPQPTVNLVIRAWIVTSANIGGDDSCWTCL